MALTAAQRRRLPVSQFADRTNRKYPIDTEKRVRAAVSYFSKPANARMYPLSERKKIWSRIKRAAKKYKITLSDHAGPPSLEKRPRPAARKRKTAKKRTSARESPALVTVIDEYGGQRVKVSPSTLRYYIEPKYDRYNDIEKFIVKSITAKEAALKGWSTHSTRLAAVTDARHEMESISKVVWTDW